jgi:hypothetical protein
LFGLNAASRQFPELQLQVNTQDVDGDLNRAAKMRQVSDNLFKCQASFPVLVEFLREYLLKVARCHDVNANINLIEPWK